MSCKRDRCETAEGPREKRDTALSFVNDVTLSMVADLSLKIDTALEPNLEMIAQPAVHDKLVVANFNKAMDIAMDGCVKEHDEILLNAVVPDLKYVEITSAGTIRSERLIEKDTLEMINRGLGDLDFVVDSKWLLTEIRSSGDLILAGETERIDFLTTSSGDLRAFNLVADTVSLNVFGSSVLEVYTDGVLQVHFFRSGQVQYRGEPAEIITTGQGTVIDANL